MSIPEMDPYAPPRLRRRKPDEVSPAVGKWRVENDGLRVWQFTKLPEVDLLNGVSEANMELQTLRLRPRSILFPSVFGLSVAFLIAAYHWELGSFIQILAVVFFLASTIGQEVVESLSFRAYESAATLAKRRREETLTWCVFSLLGGILLYAFCVRDRERMTNLAEGLFPLIYVVSLVARWKAQRLKCRRLRKDGMGRSEFLVTGVHPDALRYLAEHSSAT